jgi:hypothetical protein
MVFNRVPYMGHCERKHAHFSPPNKWRIVSKGADMAARVPESKSWRRAWFRPEGGYTCLDCLNSADLQVQCLIARRGMQCGFHFVASQRPFRIAK